VASRRRPLRSSDRKSELRLLLVFALLGLAWSDWTANLRYARRHRRAIADERRAFLDDLRRRRAYPGNGQGDPEGPLGRSPLA